MGRLVVWAAGWALLLVGCATPIGVERVNLRQAYRQIEATALNARAPSSAARAVLHRYNLGTLFEKAPEAALRALHARACEDERRDLLYALAELCYLHGERLARSVKPGAAPGAARFHLSAAVYAYLYLLGDGPEAPPSAFDRRFRAACELYNRGLAKSLQRFGGDEVMLSEGDRPLLVGRLRLRLDRGRWPWGVAEFERLIPADNYAVRGASMRLREAGLGAPLIGIEKTERELALVPPVPLTVFLRLEGGVRQLQEGTRGALELYSAYDRSEVVIGPHRVPLETDATAALAYGLHASPLWGLDFKQFFSGRQIVKTGTYSTQPHQPGRVPVVFVHGTASNPAWWAEMWNTLRADPVLRRRCQFWFFLYNTGNPIGYSAAQLRDSLTNVLHTLDPRGRDAALRQMVVIGHSQGGLLAKLTACDTGDRLWRALSDRPVMDLDLTAEERAYVERTLFFKPLPCVRRVVFIATPHRGSFLATSFLGRLVRRFISLPGDIVRFHSAFRSGNRSDRQPNELRGPGLTSLEQMAPSNPLLLALADVPPASDVPVHSIIAVKGPGDPALGNDGVVAYASAHTAHARSELVVRDGHSCQGHPLVIEEVRRILREHLNAVAGVLPPDIEAATPARR